MTAPLDDAHLWAAVRYVERNPVRAALVRRAEDWPWSSAAAHCGRRTNPLLCPSFPPPHWNGMIPDWSAWLADEVPAEIAAIRHNTHSGRPCGTTDFVRHLEDLLGRPLLPPKRGRKPNDPTRKEPADGNE